jgi:WD40 repeat protein
LKGELRGHDNNVVTLAYNRSGTRLASGSFDKTIRLWNAETMKEISRLEGHTKVVNSVAFSPDSTRLFSGSGDMTVRIWDVVTRQQLLKLEGGMREVNRVAVAARDGRRVACVGSDRIVRVWEADMPARKQGR